MGNRKNFLPRVVLALALLGTTWAPLWPQSPTAASTAAQSYSQSPPEWQIAAGGKMAFDTASVRQNTIAPPGARNANFPLGPGDVYVPNRGVFRAMNFPLSDYIEFAYKVTPNQEQFLLSELPKWATTDRFDIQAKAEGNPTKDQMRLMMQTLLADRFTLAIHYETRQTQVLALVVDQPGRLGPLLQKHPEDAACPTTPTVPSPPPNAAAELIDTRFPRTCGGILDMAPSAPGRVRAGARNVTMDLIASSLVGAGSILERPIVDRTGLTGRFDYALEVAAQNNGVSPPSRNAQREPAGPTLAEALKEQLGLRLEEQTGPMDLLIIDYVEQPLPN